MSSPGNDSTGLGMDPTGHDGPTGPDATEVSRVAVLSDIHGALPALDAVLAEPEVRSADLIVLNGDHAAGPLPVATLDRLTQLGDRAVWVRGNADRELVALARGADATSVPDLIAPWAAAQLREDQVRLLESLPLSVTVRVAGFGPVRFCHATGVTTRWWWWCWSTPGSPGGRRCWPGFRRTRWCAATPTCRSCVGWTGGW